MLIVSGKTDGASWWALWLFVFVSGCGGGSSPQSKEQPRGIDARESDVSKVGGAGQQPVASAEPTKTAKTLPALENVPNGHALLVGCSRYPNLAEKFQLKGPANDVVLTKNLLIERFGFPAENIVLLSENAGDDDQLPTRENIQRQWQHLADIAQPGDQIVVLMAGHGSQAPQLQQSEDDVEPDGLDEIFLPRDVGKWQDGIGKVENSIPDDEIRQWIQAVKATGASLFLVFDACHSGTMTRGGSDEVKRELPYDELGVPSAVMQKAAAIANTSDKPDGETQVVAAENPGSTRSPSVELTTKADEPTVVALYAAQSIEPTIETEFPRLGQNRQTYGLLTYTLNQILTQVESKITYRELVERIHRKYVDLGRFSPTPLLEGSIDNVVLGLESFPQRSRVRVTGNKRNGWKVNAGALTGLTKGSILAVYPPAGDQDADKVIGHVRILDAGFSAVESKVKPCEFADLPAFEQLEAGMRCETVYVDFGDQRLRLSVDTATDENEPLPPERRRELVDQLIFPSTLQQLVEVFDDTADATWLLRYDSLASNQLFLVPASGWPGEKEGKLPPLFGPLPAGDGFLPKLSDSLRKIHRVQTLLNISGGDAAQSHSKAMLDVTVLRYEEESGFRDGREHGKVVTFERGGTKLHAGDYLRCQINNNSRKPVDVTILWIDADYGISCVFPDSGHDNRIAHGGELSLHLGTIEPEHTGLEHLIAIAVEPKAVDQSTSFAFLQQEVIDRTRAVDSESPLAKLLKTSMYGIGMTRGLGSSKIDSYQIRTKSFMTSAEPRPSD